MPCDKMPRVKRIAIPPLGGFLIVGVILLSFCPIYFLCSHGHFILALVYFVISPLVLNILLGTTIYLVDFFSQRRRSRKH